ncbi:unnamed protein product [Ilex paraguariensis]|uniref:Uncharacterized protein n=1 Tax=Ilex paraguariensis TaxID=185542 RepID=A0ABC8SQ02_9AQUA
MSSVHQMVYMKLNFFYLSCKFHTDEQCASDGLHEVEFLLPFMQDTSLEACSRKDVIGVLVFRGSVCSFAYLNSKESISQALADMKVLKDNCVELMSMEASIDESTILEPETEAPTSTTLATKSFWEMAVPFSSASVPDCSSLKNSRDDTCRGSHSESDKSVGFNIWAAVLGLILSVLVGLVLFVFRPS